MPLLELRRQQTEQPAQKLYCTISLLITPLTPEMSSEGIPSSPSGRMTLISGLVRHPKLPPYEIWYDASIWQYTEREDEEPGLINREDPNCYLSLRGEAGEAPPVAKVVLAGLEWTIYDGKYSTYYSITDPFNYIFRVDLPDPYQLTAKSTCQQLAEEVINTFRIMD